MTNEQLQSLIDDLIGTCDDIEAVIPEDITADQIDEICSRIFQCEGCNLWIEVEDETDDQHFCKICVEIVNYE